jgi:hypothetical protein
MSLLLPVARSLILCTDVLPGPQPNTFHFIAVGNAVRPKTAYPGRIDQLCVVVQLTDGRGSVPMVVRVVNPDTEEEIMRTAEHGVLFPSRHSVVWGLFRLRNCTYPSPGVYWVELYAHGQLLTDTVLHLLEARA